MSGSAAASNIEGFVYVCMNAFHQTAVNFTGQNVGAGQYKRVGKIAPLCLACVTVVGVVAGGLVYLLGPQLLSIYITDSAEAIQHGILRLGYVALPYFLLGLMTCSTSAMRGLGYSVSPMFITLLGACGLRIAWVYTVFEKIHTMKCLYISYPVSWIVTFAVLWIMFHISLTKKMKAQNKSLQRSTI